MFKESILRIILFIDGNASTALAIFSAIVGIASAFIEFRTFKIRKRRAWLWLLNILILISVLVFAASVIRKNIEEVPDVVGKTYQDACNILSSCGLNYTLAVDNGVYVMEQTPAAGKIVRKNYQVELKTEPIGNNPEVRDRWLESLGEVRLGNISVTFRDTEIILQDNDGVTKECYGSVIRDYAVKKAYLYQPEVGVEFHDYNIENGVMTFENIPCGIEFQLIVWLEGYEEAKIAATISSQNALDSTYSFTWGILKNDADIRLPATFYVADASRSNIMDVKYMPDVDLSIQWPENKIWRGDYITDKNGRFPYTILINKDQKIRVKIIDPFDNGVDYECEVTLYALEFDEAFVNDIIFLKQDGTCEVISTEDYFMW